jgi:hypothetical protein
MEDREDTYTRDTQPIPRRWASEPPAAQPASAGPEPALTETVAVPGYPAAVRDQDRIPTPVPLEAPKNSFVPARPRASWAMRLVVAFCLVVALVSLALNLILIRNLLGVQKTFTDGVDQALAAVDNASGEVFAYEYRFQQTIPFESDIPFQQDLVIPFQGNIPINTTVQVPINAGPLGKFTIDVPINTEFYVDIEVPVHVDQTFHVATEVPVDITFPISISADDPAIQKLLSGVREWLVELRESF